MKDFDTRAYSISDFKEWNQNGLLELSPDFQRRTVWLEKAKSYLIDTIIRGKPIPKILISQELKDERNVRTVVDGQQRLRAILEFLNGDFKISKAHNKEYADCYYQSLPNDVQKDFMQYELGVDILFGMGNSDLLDVFARINSYTVSLNKQEKLNALYLGYFKQAAFGLGFKYVDYLIRGNIITKTRMARMGEAELASDMLAALVDGVQTNKTIEQLYKKYEDKPGNIEKATEQFDKIFSYIGTIYSPEEIEGTNWSRVHLFYTLFTAIGHCLFGISNLKTSYKCQIRIKDISRIRICLDEISANYDAIAADIDNPNNPKDYLDFINRSRRGTTDTQSRIDRANFVCRKITERFQNAK
ncbi:DUF262 domain-containing protein [Patescibacteria group bacterium]|nr:DUF262 domain-containing protein [Patescibacteria group bacterium]